MLMIFGVFIYNRACAPIPGLKLTACDCALSSKQLKVVNLVLGAPLQRRLVEQGIDQQRNDLQIWDQLQNSMDHDFTNLKLSNLACFLIKVLFHFDFNYMKPGPIAAFWLLKFKSSRCEYRSGCIYSK